MLKSLSSRLSAPSGAALAALGAVALAGPVLFAPGCASLGDLFESQVTRPDRAGTVRGGKQVGPWEYYYVEGGERAGLEAAGNYEGDKQVGKWTYYYTSGQPRWEVVFVDEAMSGPTTFYYENGNIQATGAFASGLAEGFWTYFDEEGAPTQSGTFADGARTGTWRYWRKDGRLLAEGERAADKPTGDWKTWDNAGTETTVAEASLDLPEELEQRPSMPIEPQPSLTMTELDILEYLVSIYSIGRDEAVLPENTEYASKTGEYGPAQLGKKKRRDVRKSDTLVGKPIPVPFLTDIRGRELDLLAPSRNGKRSVVVILRGQSDEVCVYCLAQTESLELNRDQFAEKNTDVAIVYPGYSEHLDSFLKIYREEFGPEETSFQWAYDGDFGLVDSLEIRKDMALPTTLILDEQGIVRYAYVGLRLDDRPSAAELLEFIDTM